MSMNPDDEQRLRQLNVRIGTAESEGDREFLSNAVAPTLAFRRANGTYVDRDTFLNGIELSARRDTEIESIVQLGRDRAVVNCVVSLIDGNQIKRFHNVRLFVRSSDGEWRLLGWANEQV